jgi:hypothetical protein
VFRYYGNYSSKAKSGKQPRGRGSFGDLVEFWSVDAGQADPHWVGGDFVAVFRHYVHGVAVAYVDDDAVEVVFRF